MTPVNTDTYEGEAYAYFTIAPRSTAVVFEPAEAEVVYGETAVVRFSGAKSAALPELTAENNNITAELVLPKGKIFYSGLQKKPAAEVYVGGERIEERFYDVIYGENVGPGTGTVTVEGKNGLVFTKTAEFEILPADREVAQKEVNNAKAFLKSLKVSADGSDVSTDETWVPREVYDQLAGKIEEAENLLAGDSYPADELGRILEELSDAAAAAQSASDTGKQIPINQDESTPADNLPDSSGSVAETDTGLQTESSGKIAKDIYGNVIVTAEQKEQQILSLKNDSDPAGSTFALLQAKQKKVTKTSIRLTWKRVNGASSYVIYGNKCGKKNHYKKLRTVTGTSFTQKNLKKGTYYKYLIIAVGDGKALATSKTIHAAAAGGKVGNAKAVKVNKGKVTIKKNKSFRIKASSVAQSAKLKIRNHRKIAFESSDPKVAAVNSKGKIKGVGKGSCKIYVYAQNGVYKVISVKVK